MANRNRTYAFRLTTEDYARIKTAAKELDMNMSELIRLMIRRGIACEEGNHFTDEQMAAYGMAIASKVLDVLE